MSGLKGLSRRSFLKGGALLGADIIGSASIAACSSGASQDSISWDRETDVLVVGSGFAGYSAALRASDAGAQVMLIDKRDSDGGNSQKCDGDFGVCNSSAQKEIGIQDSVDAYINDMLVAGLYLNDVGKCRAIAEKTNEVYEWLNDLGVKWVKSSDNLQRSDNSHRKYTTVKVKKGVVLATGGFGGDVAWRMQHDPRLDETIGDTNRPGATRDALEPALRANALAVHLDWIQLGPWCSPDIETYGPDGTYIDAGFPYGPVVAPQTGKRIVNELTDRKRYCDAILANKEPLIQIVDERNLPEWSLKYFEQCIDAGCTWRMNSIEEIAERFSIPLEALKAEMTRYNTFVAEGVDGDFGKAIPKDALPVEEPPYCVTRV